MQRRGTRGKREKHALNLPNPECGASDRHRRVPKGESDALLATKYKLLGYANAPTKFKLSVYRAISTINRVATGTFISWEHLRYMLNQYTLGSDGPIVFNTYFRRWFITHVLHSL